MVKWSDEYGNIETKIIVWKENIYDLIIEEYLPGWEEKDNLDKNLNVPARFSKVLMELTERPLTPAWALWSTEKSNDSTMDGGKWHGQDRHLQVMDKKQTN